MSAFSPYEIEKLELNLDNQIQLLIQYQNQLNNPRKNPELNELIESLSLLKSSLEKKEVTKLNWYKSYLSIFETKFFKPLADEYIRSIREAYYQLWLMATNLEQQEFAKLNSNLWRYPNLGILSADNFQKLVFEEFKQLRKTWLYSYEVRADFSKTDRPGHPGIFFMIILSDNKGNKLTITVYLSKVWIEVSFDDEGAIGYESGFKDAIMDQICEVQRRAKRNI